MLEIGRSEIANDLLTVLRTAGVVSCEDEIWGVEEAVLRLDYR